MRGAMFLFAVAVRRSGGLVPATRGGALRSRPASTRLSSTTPSDPTPWAALGLREDLAALAAQHWATPNAVQRNAIRAALEGSSDLVVGAETGSGKTLAYLLPAAQAAMESKAPKGPTADAPRAGQYPTVLVLVPNRELGTQLVRVAAQLGGDTAAPFADAAKPFSLCARHGGLLKTWPFRPGACPDILVATPSFAAAFDKDLDLWDHLRVVVLDEADMLLDGGFKTQIERCLVALKRVERRREAAADLVEEDQRVEACMRVVVAATLPNYGLRSVENLVAKYFGDAKKVEDEAGRPLRIHAAPATLAHAYVDAAPGGLDARFDQMERVVDVGERTMVFCKTAATAAAAADRLADAGTAAAAYTKDVPPERRLAILDAFARGDLAVLVCTDLAARGLDLPAVDHVVQLDFATDVVSHLHRVGRAARAGNSARATSFVTDANRDPRRRHRGRRDRRPGLLPEARPAQEDPQGQPAGLE